MSGDALTDYNERHLRFGSVDGEASVAAGRGMWAHDSRVSDSFAKVGPTRCLERSLTADKS